MKKCLGKIAGILWMPVVMEMILGSVADTSAYAAGMIRFNANTTVNAIGMVYAAEMAADTTVDADDIKKNAVFQVSTGVELHETPDTASAVTAALPGGTPVIIKEDARDGWCKAAYREQTGYVQISFLSIVGSPVAPAPANDWQVSENGTAQNNRSQGKDQAVQNDGAYTDDLQSGDSAQNDQTAQAGGTQPTGGLAADTLDDEFKMIQKQNLQSYQEALDAKEQVKSNKVWGIVIAALIVTIFAVGIVTALRGNRR